MTHPRQSAGQPPFEDAAAATIAAARGQQRRPVLPVPLTPEEQAEADKAAQTAEVCLFCLGYHHAPSTQGCPRLATFQLDGQGRVTSGTYWPGRSWAKGRVVLFEDTKESEPA